MGNFLIWLFITQQCTFLFKFIYSLELNFPHKNKNFVQTVSRLLHQTVSLNRRSKKIMKKSKTFKHILDFKNWVALTLIKQDRFTTFFKTCGTGSLFWRVGRGSEQTDRQDWWWVGAKHLWCQGWANKNKNWRREALPITCKTSGNRIAQIWLDFCIVWTLFPVFEGQGVHFWSSKTTWR